MTRTMDDEANSLRDVKKHIEAAKKIAEQSRHGVIPWGTIEDELYDALTTTNAALKEIGAS